MLVALRAIRLAAIGRPNMPPPLALRRVGNLDNQHCRTFVPIAVRLGSGEVKLPDGRDPVARQHRMREVFGPGTAKGHTRTLQNKPQIEQ